MALCATTPVQYVLVSDAYIRARIIDARTPIDRSRGGPSLVVPCTPCECDCHGDSCQFALGAVRLIKGPV